MEEAVKNSVLVGSLKNTICWCNQYRLVPKANKTNSRHERSESVHGSKTLQNFYFGRSWENDFTISIHPTLQDLLKIQYIEITYTYQNSA
jgi:hypothetical protein